MHLVIRCILTSLLLMGVPIQALSYTATKMAEGIDVPWGLGFLPTGGFLVTSREGKLWYFDPSGNRTEIGGLETSLPDMIIDGQGGLMDIEVSWKFANTRTVYISYSALGVGGLATKMISAKLDTNLNRLKEVKVLFEMARAAPGSRHFGGRIVETRDGHLFLTIGDRGMRDLAQDLRRHEGKIIRVKTNGQVPSDNPYKRHLKALPEIWSLGHRNPQGASLDAKGNLWVSEHGPRGGDEVNKVGKAKNYGWPLIGYGVHYNGDQVGLGTHHPQMEQPEAYWDPSIAPSGLAVYQGQMFKDWQGDILVGSLKFDYIARLSGDPLAEVEQIKLPQTGRVRDVQVADDGSVWFLSENDGAVYRLTP